MNPNPKKKNHGVLQWYLPGTVGSLLLALLSSLAVAKTPERILAQVSSSVVGVDVIDAHGKSVGQGSGVVIGEGQVITSCQGIKEGAKEAKKWQVRQSGRTFNATLQSAAPDRDLCQLNVPRLPAPRIALGTAGKLEVGQRVYAVGAPTEGKGQEGWKPLLSEGMVSILRPYQESQYIQISVTISPGFSGGGLFDNEGRLIGILSHQSIEGQDLTFAMPADWIAALAKPARPVPAATKKDGLNWLNRTLALEKKGDWTRLLKLSQQEVKRDSTNAVAWFDVGLASAHLKQYSQAVHAFREAIRHQAEYDEAWHALGIAYANLKEYDNAIEAYGDALRIQPENGEAWYDLGNTHYALKHYAHAIHSYREALRIRPENAAAWYNLGITYEDLKLYGEAAEAYLETVRIQPENADAWYRLGVAYSILGERGKMREIYQTLRKLDVPRAEQYFNTYILP